MPVRLSFTTAIATPITTPPMGPPKQTPKASLKRPHHQVDKTPSTTQDGPPPQKVIKLKVNSSKLQQIQSVTPNPAAYRRAQSTPSAPRPSPAPSSILTPTPPPLNPSMSPAPISTPQSGPVVVKARRPLPDSAPAPPPLVKKPSIVLKLKTNPKPS